MFGKTHKTLALWPMTSKADDDDDEEEEEERLVNFLTCSNDP
jgi:hypothetical protein